MKARNVVYTLLFIIALLGFAVVKKWQEPGQRELFDRSLQRLEYTRLALCRMKCRGITKGDVEEILQEGIINLNRSDRRYRPCPAFALQGRTKRGRYLRVLFAQCDRSTNLISCMDVEQQVTCTCPGERR